MPKQSTRIKRASLSDLDKVANQIELASPHRQDFTVTDKRHHNSEDTRDTMRSGEKRTLRRLTRIERLVKLQIIDKDQATACQWYADAHELGFVAQLGLTANLGGAGGCSGGRGLDHMAKNEAQRQARLNFAFGRAGIPEELWALFDSVVLPDQLGENEFRAVTRNEVLRIGIAAWRLYGQVSHLLAVAA